MGYIDPVSAARILLASAMLGYASWRDVKTREISDSVWIVFGGAGLILDVWEMWAGALGFFELGVSVGVAVAVGLVFGWFGFFGEADILAFASIAAIHPVSPRLPFTPLGAPPLLFVYGVISNAVLVGASAALLVFVLNVAEWGGSVFSGLEEPTGKKLLLLFTGRKKRTEKIRGPPFEYPLEAFKGESSSRRSILLRPDISDDASASMFFTRAKRLGVGEVWVSVTLPFILVLALGYALVLGVGDIIFTMFSMLF